MRVALFFDGKSFYVGWKEETGSARVHLGKLADWLVQQVQGRRLWGAYYYTGIAYDPREDEGPGPLERFLNALELQPGFFVKRFIRASGHTRCTACGASIEYTQEKGVDTTMVADMLRLAAVDAFDIAVLLSGDADHFPAVEGVRALGKQVYLATWGPRGVSTKLRKAVFDHIDLRRGLDTFLYESQDRDHPEEESEEVAPISGTAAFHAALQLAEAHFGSGFVGLYYFIRKWVSDKLPADPDERMLLLEQTIEEGIVEIYTTREGTQALRSL